jgi:hypothetical protein
MSVQREKAASPVQNSVAADSIFSCQVNCIRRFESVPRTQVRRTIDTFRAHVQHDDAARSEQHVVALEKRSVTIARWLRAALEPRKAAT